MEYELGTKIDTILAQQQALLTNQAHIIEGIHILVSELQEETSADEKETSLKTTDEVPESTSTDIPSAKKYRQ